MKERRAIVWFLVIAFGFSWPLFVLPLAFKPLGQAAQQIATLAAWTLAMWGPGLGAIVATRRALDERLATLNLGRLGPKRFYMWAWLLPPALAVVTGLLTLALGAGRFEPARTMETIREAMAGTPGGETIPPGAVLAIQIALSFTLAPLFNTLFALGEELGWRGFLLRELLSLGQWRAILISGAVWGVWHAPAILQGLNYPSRPVLGVLMMIVAAVLLGAIFSWLYLQTQSPWAPALAHGSLNATAGLPALFMPQVDFVIGGVVTSLTGWLGLAAFVAWLALSGRLPVLSYSETQEGTAPGSPAV